MSSRGHSSKFSAVGKELEFARPGGEPLTSVLPPREVTEPNKLASKDRSPVYDFEIGCKNFYFDQGDRVQEMWISNALAYEEEISK